MDFRCNVLLGVYCNGNTGSFKKKRLCPCWVDVFPQKIIIHHLGKVRFWACTSAHLWETFNLPSVLYTCLAGNVHVRIPYADRLICVVEPNWKVAWVFFCRESRHPLSLSEWKAQKRRGSTPVCLWKALGSPGRILYHDVYLCASFFLKWFAAAENRMLHQDTLPKFVFFDLTMTKSENSCVLTEIC